MKASMKIASRAAAIIAMAGFMASLLASCKPGGAAPVELGNYENAIKVTPTLDTERANSQTIGFSGGTVSATAADGTVFTLTIPADSLRQVTRITLTPVTKLDGLPFGEGTDVTVDLQPSGLVFDVPATLAIEPAKPISAGEQILYGYSDNRLVFAEPALGAKGIAIVVSHFSGYGAAKGLMGDVEEARKRIGGSAEERIGSEMRAAMQEAQQAEMRGEPGPNLGELLDPYFQQYEREVLKPRLAAAGQSCAAGRSAITSLLGYQRQRELLGYEDDTTSKDNNKLLKSVVQTCMDEEYEMCVNDHVVHRILPAYLASSRQLALFGIGETPLENKMKKQVEGCLHFDLEFKVDTRFELDRRAFELGHMLFAEGTELSTEIVFSIDETLNNNALHFKPSSGPMGSLRRLYRDTTPGCVQGSISTWSDTGHFLAMSFVGDYGSLDEGGGGIEEIEVEIGLPSPVATMSGWLCPGQSVPSVPWTGLAPVIYMDIHGDGFIRDWKILGGETFAIAEWKAVKHYPPTGLVKDNGTATLRHTPR